MIVDEWVDWAVRRDGPPNKLYPQANKCDGIVFHSMEGWLGGSLRELDKPDRQSSWMFSVDLDGTLYQHYPVVASPWASGNFVANTSYWSVESAGLQGTPLNEQQIQTVVRLIGEWEDYTNVRARRPQGVNSGNLLLHREVATIYSPNAGGTACPSARYDPVWERLKVQNDRSTSYMDPLTELNNALVKRFRLIELASGDYEKMLSAYEILKKNGFFQES